MQEYNHPVSGIKIRGVRLGDGAFIKKTDYYDCSDGSWRHSPHYSDNRSEVRIKPGCQTIFIRREDISPEAKNLLMYLTANNLLLTRRSWWKAIPSLKWKNDGRMDWRVRDQACVQELIEYGFLYPHPEDDEVHGVSELGRKYIEF